MAGPDDYDERSQALTRVSVRLAEFVLSQMGHIRIGDEDMKQRLADAGLPADQAHVDSMSECTVAIGVLSKTLVELAKARGVSLDDAIRLVSFVMTRTARVVADSTPPHSQMN